MASKRLTKWAALFAILTVSAGTALAQRKIVLDEGEKLTLYGDFRLRIESDWDSRKANGDSRDDRTRARIRFRLGLDFKPSDRIAFGIRMRTGDKDSHQSPHLTFHDFDGNPRGDADVDLDKWFMKTSFSGASLWLGRNSLPFWKQNEMFWDDDATPAGVGGTYTAPLGASSALSFNGGFFTAPVGMRRFSGSLGVGQGVLKAQTSQVGWTFSSGLLAFNADLDDPDANRLLNGNGLRDYRLWISSAQAAFKLGSMPLKLGVDFTRNLSDYEFAEADSFTAANRDEKTGYVAQASLGSLKRKGDWLAAYYNVRIEALSVNASYSQDDWMRFGSASETRSSNFKGHEFRFAYALRSNLRVVARLYLVDAITNVEDGKRFRIDFDYKF